MPESLYRLMPTTHQRKLINLCIAGAENPEATPKEKLEFLRLAYLLRTGKAGKDQIAVIDPTLAAILNGGK